jgi:hypothetical protein
MTLKPAPKMSRPDNEHKTAGQRGCSFLSNLEIARETLHDLRKREYVRFLLLTGNLFAGLFVTGQ